MRGLGCAIGGAWMAEAEEKKRMDRTDKTKRMGGGPGIHESLQRREHRGEKIQGGDNGSRLSPRIARPLFIFVAIIKLMLVPELPK